MIVSRPQKVAEGHVRDARAVPPRYYVRGAEVNSLVDPDIDHIVSHIRKAVIRLYEAYRPVRDAFEAFANDVLVKIVKSLPYNVEKFTPPRVTKFSEMSPVLFVEEPGPGGQS